LSLWGAVVGLEPITVQTLGLLSGSVPAAAGGVSTLNGLLDISDQQTELAAQAFSDQTFAVDTSGSGRGELTLEQRQLQVQSGVLPRRHRRRLSRAAE
jgi:hypothetical protein